MRSPHNPTAEYIEKWAADAEADEPVQDWDLTLTHLPYEDIYLRLAASTDCPKQGYFLSLLYSIVGNAVRSNYKSKPRDEIERLLTKAQPGYRSHSLYLLVRRSRDLMENPALFNHEDWCNGGLAKAVE